MDARKASISGYNKQLPNEPTNMSFGEDDVAEWENSRIYLLAAYKAPLAPTAGQRLGGRGETIEWDVPQVVARQTRWTAKDYEVENVDQLMEWQHERVQLRAWSFGMFWLRCKILDVTFSRPFKKKLEFTTLNQGLYIYRPLDASGLPSYNANLWDGLTLTQPTQNNPFLSLAAYGFTFGDVT